MDIFCRNPSAAIGREEKKRKAKAS